MSSITNFAQANEYFAQFYGPVPTDYSLDVMHALMALLGNPQDSYKVIHIAGTSGKSSTAYYTAALLKQAGYKTGLTTSPHVDELNERVQVDLQPASEAEFCEALNTFAAITTDSPVRPSWFEAVTAFAFWYFAQKNLDYAIVEVGLGGRLDATNVINRKDKQCVITDIGLDHTRILGATLPEIAVEKAGIIQPGNHVYMHVQASEVMDVVDAVCRRNDSSLRVVDDYQPQAQLPVFQQRNFALADEVVDCIVHNLGEPSLTKEQLAAAAQTYIPGRMEILTLDDGRTCIIDGAHNQQKLDALKTSILARYPGQPIAALVAFMDGDDQRLELALGELKTMAQRFVVTSFESSKDYQRHSVDIEQVAELCKQQGLDVQAIADQQAAVTALLAGPEQILLVTGSFYLLNHIRPLLPEAV